LLAPAGAVEGQRTHHHQAVGLGEGADDLAPFEPEAFVDALLGDEILS